MGRAVPAEYYPHSTFSPLDVTLIKWDPGALLHRVHKATYGSTGFNQSKAEARFSPVYDETGAVIPVMYAGTTFECALMETIFHDVMPGPGLKTVSRSTHLKGRVYSGVRVKEELTMIDLSSIALTRLRTNRARLLDTDRTHWEASRAWAQTLYTRNESAQGMLWTSRQDDKAECCILFGTRLRSPILEPIFSSTELDVALPDIELRIQLLAKRLGVDLIP